MFKNPFESGIPGQFMWKEQLEEKQIAEDQDFEDYKPGELVITLAMIV